MKPVVLANVATAVGAAFYIICATLVYAAPDLAFSIAQSWFHGINLEVVRATGPASLGSTVFGLISLSVVLWVSAYVAGYLYNYLAKK